MESIETQTSFLRSKKSKFIIVGVAMFILGMTIGVLLVRPFTTPTPCSNNSQEQTGQTNISDIDASIQATNGIGTISGTVADIVGDRITLHTQTLSQFKDNSFDEHVVLVTAETKIFKLLSKDQNAIQTEIRQSTKNGSVSSSPPEPFSRIKADATSIIVGDKINVMTAGKIKAMKEITATEIQIQPRIKIEIPQ